MEIYDTRCTASTYMYTINNKQHNNQFIIGDYDIKAFMRRRTRECMHDVYKRHLACWKSNSPRPPLNPWGHIISAGTIGGFVSC